MTNNVLDFESRKQAQLLKRKNDKVAELRKAFRLARGETGPDSSSGKSNSPGKARAKNKKK